MPGPNRNKKSETRVSSIERISILKDLGLHNHYIIKGTKQETNWKMHITVLKIFIRN